MNTSNSKHLIRRATALLGAIAASSFLGLPALAGGVIKGTSATEQAQNPSSTMPSVQCASMSTSMATQSSPSERATTLDATPDASKPGADQVPNQADPRAGNTAADQPVNRTVNQMSDGSRTQMMGSSYQMTSQMTSNRPTSAVYGNILGRGGVTAGGFANQRFVSANTPDAIREINSMSSADRGYSDRAYGTQYGNRDQANISGNVLAQGGATTGGDANQQVMAANNDATNGMNRAGMTGNTASSMNQTGTMRSDGMRSDGMNSSSQSMMGNQIAQCPPGMMMPNRLMPNRSMPNRSMPDMRDMRMMPGQSNNGTQPAPQSNQVQSSPGDGSGAR